MIRRSIISTLLLLAPAILSAQNSAPVTIVPVPPTSLPLKHAPEPTSAPISVEDLMTRLYVFADDSMQGREAGTEGNVRGTNYIASEAKRLGLVPGGENGSYFQTIPFKTRTIDPSSHLIIAGKEFTLGSDWATSSTSPLAATPLPVVFGGTLGDSSAMLDAASGAGKLVVFRVGGGPGGRRGLRGAERLAPQAAAIAIVGYDRFIPFLGRPSTFLDVENESARAAGAPLVIVSESAASSLFSSPLADLSPGAAGVTVDLAITPRVEPVPFPARNVIAILPGSDPALRGEYVAIGAHNDHVGFNDRPVDHDSLRIYNHIVRPGGAEDSRNQASPAQQQQVNELLAQWRAAHPGSSRQDSIYNGADDDGSGSVSVLEIAEHMAAMNAKPKRSILFIWHVGEEKGLLGSAYFTDNPTVPRDSIVAELNVDMDGRGDAWDVTGNTKSGAEIHGGPGYVQLVGSRRLSTEMGDLVESVNTSGKHGFTFDYSMDANGHPMNIYCRSDHYEYARYGIPITFFTTGGHSDYHQVTDEPQYIDYPRMTRVSQLIDDIAVHIANLDHRLVVDKERPDPHGRCVQ